MKKIFKAKIFHRRLHPRVNQFIYDGFYIRFSIDQLDDLKSRLFSVNRFNLFSFYEKDHGERNGTSLKLWVQKILTQSGVVNFNGEVILQTFPRMLGYVFNPVSFWYCYENKELIAVICEVNNTFGESHNYVLKKTPSLTTNSLPKEFHVSPFYPVKGHYEFNFVESDTVKIHYYDQGILQLETSVKGLALEWNDQTFIKMFLRFPFFTLQIIVLIHYQAAKIFLKKIKYYSKPQKIKREITHECIK